MTDDWFRMVWYIGLKTKHIYKAYKVWLAFVKRQFGNRKPIDIKVICMDNSSEFELTELVDKWEAEGIDL